MFVKLFLHVRSYLILYFFINFIFLVNGTNFYILQIFRGIASLKSAVVLSPRNSRKMLQSLRLTFFKDFFRFIFRIIEVTFSLFHKHLESVYFIGFLYLFLSSYYARMPLMFCKCIFNITYTINILEKRSNTKAFPPMKPTLTR